MMYVVSLITMLDSVILFSAVCQFVVQMTLQLHAPWTEARQASLSLTEFAYSLSQ